MRSCAWISNSNPCITHDSMLLTIISMSDCCGICFLTIDSGVSVGISAWGLCVYSISGDLMVLKGCISKSGCFFDNHCKAVCAGVNGCDCAGRSEYFLHSTLTLSIKSLEIILVLEFLIAC